MVYTKDLADMRVDCGPDKSKGGRILGGFPVGARDSKQGPPVRSREGQCDEESEKAVRRVIKWKEFREWHQTRQRRTTRRLQEERRKDTDTAGLLDMDTYPDAKLYANEWGMHKCRMQNEHTPEDTLRLS